MHLSKFADLSVSQIYESIEVQSWLRAEVLTFLEPYLEGIQNWANGEDIILHESRTGKAFLKTLQPYVAKKQHSVFGLEENGNMVAHAQKNHTHENFKWLNIRFSDWVESKDSILPPRKLLSLHSLHTVQDIRTEMKTWFNKLFFDAQIWSIICGESDMYRLFAHLKTHPVYGNTIGKDLHIPTWIGNSQDPKDFFKAALRDAGFENISIGVHKRSYDFQNVDALLETVIALNPTAFETYQKDEDFENLISVCRKFFQGSNESDRKIPFSYTTVVITAVKPKPWEEVYIR